jgi:hypothetical protein
MVINKRGLFLYDDNDLNGTSPTTQIIGKWDATNTNAPATFITQKAKIGNWIVSSDKFENVLSSGTNIYTGISPNGTYAFWAGAGVAGGYSTDTAKDAKFSVTTSGNVIARNIKILGGEMQVGSKFTVNTDGKVSATDVVLTGEIIAEKGTIKGNLNILQAGSLIARPLDTAPASSNRVALNATGVFAYDANGTETTQIISNAAANAPTFTTDRAKIGGWVVSPTTISSTGITLTSGSTPGSTSILASNAGGYVGIKPRSTDGSNIVLWAGTTNAPAANNATSGQAGFQVNADGQLYASGAIIQGKLIADSGSSLGGLLGDTSKIYAQNDEPTGGTYKTGDAWVDTNDSNKLYIYDSTKVAPVSKWVLAQDSESARTIANLKNKTYFVGGTTSPTGITGAVSGDLWINSSNKNKPYRYNGSGWEAITDADLATALANSQSALAKAVKFGADGAITQNLAVRINDGAAGSIHSSYLNTSTGLTVAKSSYSSPDPGFFLGWELSGTVIYPAINIGTADRYIKYSNSTGILEVKGTIRATSGSFDGDVTAGAGAITIGLSGISAAGFSINTSGAATFTNGTFAGNISATGTITGGSISGATVTGGVIRTSSSASERRIVIDSVNSKDSILFKGASTDSTTSDGRVAAGFGTGIFGGGSLFTSNFPSLTVSAPTVATNGAETAYPAIIGMSNTFGGGVIEISATWTRLRGYLELLNGFDYTTQAVRMISAGTAAPSSSIGKEGSVYFQIG